MRIALLALLAACGTTEVTTPPVAEVKPAEAPARVAAASDWAHYGAPFALGASKDCKEVIAAPDALVDQKIRVTGRIENVCQKAGCWMVLADDSGEYMRVSMKGHSFGVPTTTKTGEGTLADVEGVLIKKELDAKTLAHLKSEAKGDPASLEDQFAPKYEIEATGVSVKGS